VDLEDRVVRGDRQQLVVGAVRSDAVEELTDLPLPSTQIRPQDRRLVPIVQFLHTDGLGASADAQRALARGAHVQYPVGLAAWGHEVPATVDVQDVHRVWTGSRPRPVPAPTGPEIPTG
jgi:hypothetical protein